MIGMNDPFQDLEGQESSYGLSKLNQMVDSWATERLAIYRRQRTGPFTVTSAVASYTIGSGATWNTPRPIWIDFAGLISQTTPETELQMKILTVEEWRRIPAKTTTSSLPRSLFYDRQFNSSGYGSITLYPIPSANSQIVLYDPIAVAEFASLDDVIALPPGYRRALIPNLAVIMGLGAIDIPADVREEAVLSFGNLKASNVVTHMDTLACDPAVRAGDGRSGFNFLTGGDI